MNMNAKYGLLSYADTGNIGDEIQSLAARQFLPRVDFYIDREELSQFQPKSDERVWTILNAWYCHRPENWPPSRAIVPLLVAVHISEQQSIFNGLSPVEAILSEPAVNYLRQAGPVGARDLQTLRLLEAAGVDCYFSGCMTLTLQRPPVEREEDLVVFCEVPEVAADMIKSTTQKRVRSVSHVSFHDRAPDARFRHAEQLLSLYARASAVVTSRLHCALPCIAMGTPVFLIDMASDQGRFSGLHDFVRHAPIWAFTGGKVTFDVNNPGPNPDLHLPYRQALIDRAKRFVEKSVEMPAPDAPLSVEQRLQAKHLTVSRMSKLIGERKKQYERDLAALAKASAAD